MSNLTPNLIKINWLKYAIYGENALLFYNDGNEGIHHFPNIPYILWKEGIRDRIKVE